MNKNIAIEFKNIILPILSILFFSNISFLAMLITKNSIASLFAISIISALLFSNRMGPFYIYPFQWANPNPYYTYSAVVNSILLINIILILLNDILFKNREFLLNK
ncbi:hypothetical protein JYG23_07260 [Sedimentibacter sp. zth1]|uniref:hypothetical protein n=1 Tax=Sedimentibacter sp. zth1 TaxID=2816908 RepID=UPI001A9227B5|nr:hypothetical protein [Sedimentibacter sp. zth1]QSX07134.1 hypothetical protein JYG23_07260 [Sedimentibacter sp. zth1]